MNNTESLQEFADEANSYLEQLKNESDRGAAVIGLAFFDNLLKRLFEARMLEGNTTKDLFNSNGPLNNFSGRLKLAYCLVWIGPETYHDLDVMRKIRNDFAHKYEAISFDDVDIKSRCDGLKALDALAPMRLPIPRNRFFGAASLLTIQLVRQIQGSTRPAAALDMPIQAMDELK